MPTPSLDRALSPREFADAWVARQRAALVDGAGRDGRLTRAAGHRLAERADAGKEASDDVIAFFDRSGQQSVSVNRFLDVQHAFIVDQATAVAGANGKLSLVEARALPAHLRDDYLAVRGRLAAPVGPQPLTGQPLVDAVVARVRSMLRDDNARPLPTVPGATRGLRPLVERVVADPASGYSARAWVAQGKVWASLASNHPSPRVGFYDLGPVPKDNEVVDVDSALRSAITSAAAGVVNVSERDAPYRYVFALNPGRRPLNGEVVRSLFAAQHAELARNIFGPNTSLPDLAGRAVEVKPAAAFLQQQSTPADPTDPELVARAQKLAALRAVLEANLTNLHLVRFGDAGGQAGSVEGAVSGFLVGETPQGDLAGVFTGFIET